LAFKIILTEGVSPLAQELLHALEKHTFSVSYPSAGEDFLPLTAPVKAGVLIDTRALSGVESLNSSPWALLGGVNLPVIQISSHEVFTPSESAHGSLETDLPNGQSPRALALIEAEQATSALAKHIILRLPRLMDLCPEQWFAELMTKVSEEPWVSVSETTRLDPVCKKEACRVIIALVQQMVSGAENWGVMHLHSAEVCFEAELADYTTRFLKKELQPYARLDVVKSPSLWHESGGVLGGRRLTDNFGVQMRSWRLGVKPLLLRWLETKRRLEVT
jgi:dTDP-4-dehydrorhamnose reductase